MPTCATEKYALSPHSRTRRYMPVGAILMKLFPTNAGTVRSLECYLTATGVIAADDGTVVRSAAATLSDEYANYLRDVRGFAVSSLTHHRRASRSFLDHLEVQRISIASIRPKDVECYVSQAGKRLCRGSLQHEIAVLRGLLRFLATDGRATARTRQTDRHAAALSA